MRLTVLGSGCYAPEFKAGSVVRSPAGYAVETGSEVILMDLGFGNVRQMARAALDPARVQEVFITHRHPDHCADLAALLFLYRYGPKPASGRLRLWGPEGFKVVVAKLEAAFEPWLAPRGYELEIEELKDGQRVLGEGWRMDCRRTPHPTPALAFRLTAGKKSIFYSGDTGPSEQITEFAKGCDLIIVEATTDKPFDGHLSVLQAVGLAEAAGSKGGSKVLFTHLSAASEAALKPLLKGKKTMSLARDLQRVDVGR